MKLYCILWHCEPQSYDRFTNLSCGLEGIIVPAIFSFVKSIFVLSCLNREELDISKDDDGKFTSRFTVTLDITVDAEEVKSATHTWDTLKIDKLFPQVCFSTKEEYLECQEEFGTCMIICYRCGSIQGLGLGSHGIWRIF